CGNYPDDADLPDHGCVLLAEVERLRGERETLRELLVSCEGYVLSNGSPFPFVRMFAEDSPKVDVILAAGCYPRDASREHPGPLALNRPPEQSDAARALLGGDDR